MNIILHAANDIREFPSVKTVTHCISIDIFNENVTDFTFLNGSQVPIRAGGLQIQTRPSGSSQTLQHNIYGNTF